MNRIRVGLLTAVFLMLSACATLMSSYHPEPNTWIGKARYVKHYTTGFLKEEPYIEIVVATDEIPDYAIVEVRLIER